MDASTETETPAGGTLPGPAPSGGAPAGTLPGRAPVAPLPVPTGRVEQVQGNHVLAFDEQFDYPRSYLWELLTSPPKLERWLGRLTPGLKLGKEFSLELGGGTVTGTVVHIEPPTSLQFTWEDGFGLVSIVEFRVLPSNGGTLLQLRLHPETDDFLAEGAAGWQLMLDALRAAAAGAPAGGPAADWTALRDAYCRRFTLSPSMGVLEEEEGVPLVRFDRRYDGKLLLVNDALTADPEDQPFVELAEVDLTREGKKRTRVTVRAVVEDREGLPRLMARWHAHLDAVTVSLAGGSPHRSERKIRVLEEFYRRQLQPAG
ncbi:SRPBCC domain-containing protein [Arthrobacter sp. TMN-37]